VSSARNEKLETYNRLPESPLNSGYLTDGVMRARSRCSLFPKGAECRGGFACEQR
jgi:hypothetical protein